MSVPDNFRQHSVFSASYSLQVNKVIFGHQRVNCTLFFSANMFIRGCPKIQVNTFFFGRCVLLESHFIIGQSYIYANMVLPRLLITLEWILTLLRLVHLYINSFFHLCNRIINPNHIHNALYDGFFKAVYQKINLIIPPGNRGIHVRLHSVPHKWQQQLNLPSVEGPTTFDNAAAPVNTVTIYEQLFKRQFENSAFSFVSHMRKIFHHTIHHCLNYTMQWSIVSMCHT
jgi:hypothetical protein